MMRWKQHSKKLHAYGVGFEYKSSAAATTTLLALPLSCCLFFLRRMWKKTATQSSFAAGDGEIADLTYQDDDPSENAFHISCKMALCHKMAKTPFRVLTIPCPGVQHEDVAVHAVAANEYLVTIQRASSRVEDNSMWKKHVKFDQAEGTCVLQDHMNTLQDGLLTLFFKLSLPESLGRTFQFPAFHKMDQMDSHDKWLHDEDPDDSEDDGSSNELVPKEVDAGSLQAEEERDSHGAAVSIGNAGPNPLQRSLGEPRAEGERIAESEQSQFELAPKAKLGQLLEGRIHTLRHGAKAVQPAGLAPQHSDVDTIGEDWKISADLGEDSSAAPKSSNSVEEDFEVVCEEQPLSPESDKSWWWFKRSSQASNNLEGQSCLPSPVSSLEY